MRYYINALRRKSLANKYLKSRKHPNRDYKINLHLAFEGHKTECQYFSNLKQVVYNKVNIKIHLRSASKSSPIDVLSSITKAIKDRPLKKNDMAWLVVDIDNWPEQEIMKLHQWSVQSHKHGFAVSNPCFEFWLLLHFEDGRSVNSCKDCVRKLKRILPDYDKSVDWSKYKDGITKAITRAKELDTPAVEDWPKKVGTTVYRLVEKLIT
jgi:hypothetical protein